MLHGRGAKARLSPGAGARARERADRGRSRPPTIERRMNGAVDPPTFGWSDVNCFLRPQYIACEALATAHGTLFLFLASQQRAHGLRLALPDALRHGADSHAAFCDLTGIEFRVT